jgi:hypothetical protein
MEAMILLLLMLSASLAGCSAIPGGVGGHGVSARTDTVDVLEAVWRSATSGHHVSRVTLLYLPEADTANLTASAQVRRTLTQRGVRASTHLPVGHDTVVYRVRRWTQEQDGAQLLDVVSRWTTLISGDPSLCRSAGNTETYRAHRGPSGWSAALAGPVAHGQGICETFR